MLQYAQVSGFRSHIFLIFALGAEVVRQVVSDSPHQRLRNDGVSSTAVISVFIWNHSRLRFVDGKICRIRQCVVYELIRSLTVCASFALHWVYLSPANRNKRNQSYVAKFALFDKTYAGHKVNLQAVPNEFSETQQWRRPNVMFCVTLWAHASVPARNRLKDVGSKRTVGVSFVGIEYSPIDLSRTIKKKLRWSTIRIIASLRLQAVLGWDNLLFL